MIKIGTRINGPHGLGVVAGYNGRAANQYVQERLTEVASVAGHVGAIDMIVDSFYSGDRYPYIVKFDTGYEDVYSEQELEVV